MTLDVVRTVGIDGNVTVTYNITPTDKCIVRTCVHMWCVIYVSLIIVMF